MKQFLTACCLSFLFYACSSDYDIGKSSIMEHDRLVVNSILNPSDSIRIYFHTTFKTDSGYSYRDAKDVEIVLKENETVLFNGICPDAVLALAHYPKAGASYTIEASLPGYDRIQAETRVPTPIHCLAEMTLLGDEYYYPSDPLIRLTSFDYAADEQVGLWVTSYAFFEEGYALQYNDLYVNNLLVDKINREVGMPIKNEYVGSIYYNAFLRVKNSSLPNLDEILFTPTNARHEGEYDPFSEIQQIQVKLVAASKEYDQYCRSLYEQKAMMVYDDDISAIVFQPIRVYSNIENGLGIFAGMNETEYQFDYPERPTIIYPEW